VIFLETNLLQKNLLQKNLLQKNLVKAKKLDRSSEPQACEKRSSSLDAIEYSI